ncbi:unnamed protein product [Brassica oleracea var. botrytis]
MVELLKAGHKYKNQEWRVGDAAELNLKKKKEANPQYPFSLPYVPLFKMNILRGSSSGPAKRSRQTCLPPGLNRPATSASLPPGATRPASSASRHPLPSLAAVRSAPERRNMPLLHPQRPNGTLWFGIDDCIRKDVVSTYQSNFWGPWWTYRMVPDEKKVAWWTSFLDDVSRLKEDVIGIKRGIEVLMKMNGVDPVTFEPIQRESDASVRTPQSSQELDQNSPVH